MQKRTAAEYSEQLKLRVERLRKRGLRSMRGRLIPESLRESHAREFAVRSWVVPAFRQALGKDLLAIIMLGSMQIGVRKATKRRETSDVDVTVVVKPRALRRKLLDYLVEFRRPKPFVLASELETGVKRLFGVDCRIQVASRKKFIQFEKEHWQYPFQVLYGEKQLLNILGRNFEDLAPVLRKLQRNKRKYS